jgi:hypothetical protein
MKPVNEFDATTVLPWPDAVAREVGVSSVVLQRKRALGDAPRLYAVSERQLVTTRQDLIEWVRSKAVPVEYKCRAATRGRRSRRERIADAVFGEGGDE